MQDDQSRTSAATGESSATFLKLNEYLHTSLPEDDDDDDAATVITHMVDDNNSAADEVENQEPGHTLTPVITQHSFSDDGSVDLVYNGMRSVAGGGSITSSANSRDKYYGGGPLTPSKFASPKLNLTSLRIPGTPPSPSKVTMIPKKKSKPCGISKDISLDIVLQRLSKVEPEVALPPKAAWESKVQYLAGQIDLERDNGVKLADIEQMLERKKIRAKKDTEQAKWKSRVRDLEQVLAERKKVKEDKLRKLAVILEALKKEKKEMRKYEKPGGEGASRWAAKGHAAEYMDSTPNRPGGPDRSASLVRTAEPRSSRRSRR